MTSVSQDTVSLQKNVGEVESDGDINGLLFPGDYFWKEEKK